MKNFKYLFIVFFLVFSQAFAADYTVTTGTNVVNGNTFCGGSPCASTDTIIINGGARGNLSFQDFNGNGSYITITNENVNPDERVIITSDSSGELWAALELRDCKYVDLRGDNDADLPYGIKVIQTPSTTAKTVWARQECDHIKIGYIEMCYEGASENIVGGGLMVHDGTLTDAWIFDTFEIHHNYIYNCDYAGMYLGHNIPPTEGDPYVANFSVHDNLLEDMGAYGITLKGIHSTSGVCSIYNNTVRPSNRSSGGGSSTGLVFASNGSAWQGIGVQCFYGSTYANIYNNYIEKTKGPGLKIGDQNHQAYDNIICGCGEDTNVDWGHGIVSYYSSDGVNIYDNTIIQPGRYGIYALPGAELDGTTLSRNLIGDAVLGEWGEEDSGKIIESSGIDANIYYADVNDFSFNTWSDGSDYSNDRFRTRSLLPVDSGSGVALGANLTWENFGDITGVDILFEKDDITPDVKVIDNGNVEIYNPPSDLDYDSTYYWQIVSYGGAETGGVYSFTTTSQANPPILSGGDVKFNKNGASWKFNKNGVLIK